MVVFHYADPPLNVSTEVSQPGSLAVGSSVYLTCSSVANPAADYTWYRGASSSSSLLQVGSGEVLSLLSVEASHAGLYLCRARNSVGENNATAMLLTLDKTDSEYAGKLKLVDVCSSHVIQNLRFSCFFLTVFFNPSIC